MDFGSMGFFDWVSFLIQEYGDIFLQGAMISAYLAAAGTALGCVVGFLTGAVAAVDLDEEEGAVKRTLFNILHGVIAFYVWIFRGTPMMVQAMVVYYGSAYFGIDLDPLTCGLCIVTLNTGAYMAETVRGGIHAVDPGQNEGAAAIGMNKTQEMLLVILPQAFRNVIPQIGNYLISNVKDTSVLSVITVGELFYIARTVAGTYTVFFEVFAIVCMIYLVLTTVTTILVRLVEKKLTGPKHYKLVEPAK